MLNVWVMTKKVEEMFGGMKNILLYFDLLNFLEIDLIFLRFSDSSSFEPNRFENKSLKKL